MGVKITDIQCEQSFSGLPSVDHIALNPRAKPNHRWDKIKSCDSFSECLCFALEINDTLQMRWTMKDIEFFLHRGRWGRTFALHAEKK